VLRLVVYFLKKHNAIECNYEIYDKELIIIVRYFEEWRSKLKKIAFFISVIFDYKNLKYFTSTKQLSRRQERWFEFLSRLNFKTVYQLDKVDEKSNALIRRSEDFSRKKNEIDERHRHQHQIILKTHNLNAEIVKSFMFISILTFIFVNESNFLDLDLDLEKSQLN
jgi:hypothetical protein